jgi:NTE family protein
MTIEIDGEEKRIGLALSGGGYRAVAYHLGTFRKLQELGLLDRVDLISGVSGGSIAGAFLAANWGDPQALDHLEDFVRHKPIANSTLIGGALDPWASRLDYLTAAYDRHLFGGAKLDSLSAGPRLYLNATNLATGNMFFYVTGAGDPVIMGEHELGHVAATDQKISTAVAASSAYPPWYPPHRIDDDEFPSDQTEYITLTDGGVYDNLGINPLMLNELNDLSYALVSDAGTPFTINETPTEMGTGVLLATSGIMMEQIRGLQFQRLELAHAAGRGPKPMWFSIDSRKGEDRPGDAGFASAIRTDFRRLSADEFKVLNRHAGALCEARLRRWAPELLS